MGVHGAGEDGLSPRHGRANVSRDDAPGMPARDVGLPTPVRQAGAVELVTIGDELLLGVTVDSNAAHLARALAALGIGVARHTTVGDTEAEIVVALREALDRTGAVIATGGLGPTEDDRTRHAVAALAGVTLRRDEGVTRALRARWDRIGGGAPIPESNLSMALVPRGATLLENRLGAAPGLWLEVEGGRWLALLPGVPDEMKVILDEVLLPKLHQVAGVGAVDAPAGVPDGRGTNGVILWRTLRTTGIAESRLADLLNHILPDGSTVSLAYLPGPEGVDLRLTVRGRPREEAGRLLEEAAALVYERVGDRVYGEGETDLAGVVLDSCRRRGWRVAVAESCTGGMLGARLTAHGGSSDVVAGGVISYANEVKVGLLGVREEALASLGAVSEEVAREMASGARARLSVDVGVGITGVAGPGGGSAAKPVGSVWIAVDVAGTVEARLHHFPGDRAEVRFRATQAALEMIRIAGMAS